MFPQVAQMTRAQEYRRQAEDCLQLAEQTRSLEMKASFLGIAQDWYQLALNAEVVETPDDAKDG